MGVFSAGSTQRPLNLKRLLEGVEIQNRTKGRICVVPIVGYRAEPTSLCRSDRTIFPRLPESRLLTPTGNDRPVWSLPSAGGRISVHYLFSAVSTRNLRLV